jgi:hypothetical protein
VAKDSSLLLRGEAAEEGQTGSFRNRFLTSE